MVGVVWYFIPIRMDFISRILRNRALVYLGSISYVMYLIHLVVLNIVKKIGYNDFLTSIISLVIVVAMASFSWHFFEYPISRWKNRF